MRRTRLALVVAAIALGLQIVTAQSGDTLSLVRVKAAKPHHRALLRDGSDRSPTFRQLIGEIEASGWLVFVQAGRCPEKAVVACLLHFVGTFDGAPYLRVIVTPSLRQPEHLIVGIAHELQHAREIIEAPGVHDAAGIRDLYKRIGWVSVERAGVTTYETDRALHLGQAVWRELVDTR